MAINPELSTALKAAKTKPMSFAFIAKGSEGKLLVDKKKIAPKEVDKARKECGGGSIFKGRCLMEDGKMVFEIPKEGPNSLAALIKKIIKTDGGLSMDVIIRVNAELAESEQGETEPTTQGAAEVPPQAPPSQPQAGPTADPRAALVMKRLNGMTADIKLAIAGPNKARVQTLFVTVNGAIKTKNFEQADKILDELEPLVKQGPGGGPSTEQEEPVLSPEFSQFWTKAKAAWQGALDTVNGQLESLRGQLVGANDPDLKKIAEFGLNAITANHRVPLEAALGDVDATPDADKEKAIHKALDRVRDFRTHIDNDERVEACDNNPWGVKVTLRSELDGALTKLEQALDDAFVM
jgi:hypothetical protein